MGSAPVDEVIHPKLAKSGLGAALDGGIKYLFHVTENHMNIFSRSRRQAQDRLTINQSRTRTPKNECF